MKHRTKDIHSARERKNEFERYFGGLLSNRVLEEEEKEIRVTATFHISHWLGEGLHNQKSKKGSKFKRKNCSSFFLMYWV